MASGRLWTYVHASGDLCEGQWAHDEPEGDLEVLLRDRAQPWEDIWARLPHRRQWRNGERVVAAGMKFFYLNGN
jgi:hypothetical protein